MITKIVHFQNIMYKKTWFWLSISLLGFLGIYFYITTQGISNLPFGSSAIFYKEKAVELAKNAEEGVVKKLTNRIITEDTFRLSNAGVILWTNKSRTDNNLAPLAENAVLDKVAEARAKDMFAKQYFAHVAPDGGKAELLAADFGYEYIIIGENIAMGNFDGDEDLVTSWMNSPGHRENILKNKYTEIGVSEIFGIYEVQIFGTPKSACPEVDASLKIKIEANNAQIRTMKIELDLTLAQINNLTPGTAEYSAKVAYYNGLVNSYNSLANENKIIVEKYNAEANAYNACLAAD